MGYIERTSDHQLVLGRGSLDLALFLVVPQFLKDLLVTPVEGNNKSILYWDLIAT